MPGRCRANDTSRAGDDWDDILGGSDRAACTAVRLDPPRPTVAHQLRGRTRPSDGTSKGGGRSLEQREPVVGRYATVSGHAPASTGCSLLVGLGNFGAETTRPRKYEILGKLLNSGDENTWSLQVVVPSRPAALGRLVPKHWKTSPPIATLCTDSTVESILAAYGGRKPSSHAHARGAEDQCLGHLRGYTPPSTHFPRVLLQVMIHKQKSQSSHVTFNANAIDHSLVHQHHGCSRSKSPN